jgi:hypothetical protein
MRDEYEKQFARFNKEIAGHTVKVLRDDGLYRHLRCRRGDSYCMGFDIVTWPGYLSYTGDMGCFVFTRLPDMFEFFRGRRSAIVDRRYLAEKCVAKDKPDGIREYSEALFRAAIKERFDSYVADHELTEAQAADLWEQIQDEVLPNGDNHQDAVRAAMDFRWVPADEGHTRGWEVFTDFYEHRLEEFTTRFWWCCYAVPWAIERYDEMHKAAESAAPAATV